MITLIEAFKLCRIEDREVVWLSDSVDDELFCSFPITGKEVRNKYDMKNTLVTAIVPHGYCEFEGFAFIVKKTDRQPRR